MATQAPSSGDCIGVARVQKNARTVQEFQDLPVNDVDAIENLVRAILVIVIFNMFGLYGK